VNRQANSSIHPFIHPYIQPSRFISEKNPQKNKVIQYIHSEKERKPNIHQQYQTTTELTMGQTGSWVNRSEWVTWVVDQCP